MREITTFMTTICDNGFPQVDICCRDSYQKCSKFPEHIDLDGLTVQVVLALLIRSTISEERRGS